MVVPKFRAWDKENKKMLVVNDICNLFWENTFLECYELVPDPKGKREYELINHRIDFEDCVLMQSTGLFDKNGQEIFEDDVVKLKYTVLSDYEFFKVTRFRGGSWRIDNRQRGSELWLRNEDCEIIGNIYENPELMEAEND